MFLSLRMLSAVNFFEKWMMLRSIPNGDNLLNCIEYLRGHGMESSPKLEKLVEFGWSHEDRAFTRGLAILEETCGPFLLLFWQVRTLENTSTCQEIELSSCWNPATLYRGPPLFSTVARRFSPKPSAKILC